MKTIFKNKTLKISSIIYLIIFIVSIILTYQFNKWYFRYHILEYTLPIIVTLPASYIFYTLSIFAKYKFIKCVIILPISAVLMILNIFWIYYQYSGSDYAKNSGPYGNRYCVEDSSILSQAIPCKNNGDCKWERMVKYCSPLKVSTGLVDCAPAVKCSPEGFCADYCH